jgi:ribose 5-phosphate isomerase
MGNEKDRDKDQNKGQNKDQEKEAAGRAAAKLVRDGDIIGLGTGSTAYFAVVALGERVKAGLRIIGIPTSWTNIRKSMSPSMAPTKSIPS